MSKNSGTRTFILTSQHRFIACLIQLEKVLKWSLQTGCAYPHRDWRRPLIEE